ncbi:MAG TPA: Zn-ribbon domain-containing protein [Methanocorpusculum sp.]|nr:Zn-ribbon domain-containing protein [Methanocorpusculum sp.]
MPHKCIKCGRDFRDGSIEILSGCPSCGGKKFVYVSNCMKNVDILENKTVQEIVKGTKQEVLEVHPTKIQERVESVRIMEKGKYELNLERLANSQDIIIGIGSDGKYMLDLVSMSKKARSSSRKSRK